jgi:hypothetical protein
MYMKMKWTLNLKKVAIIVLIALPIIAFAIWGGEAIDKRSDMPGITLEQYHALIKHVEETGQIIITKEDYKCRVRDFALHQDEELYRGVEIIYCYPPCSGANVRMVTQYKNSNGTVTLSMLSMDDADMDMEPNSIILITKEVDPNTRKVLFENTESLIVEHPLWNWCLGYLYQEMRGEL